MTAPLLFLALALGHPDPDTTIHLPRRGSVEVDTYLHAITLHIGTTDAVTVRGASAELDGNTVSISENGQRSRSGGDIDLTVPSWARVEISTVGGSITLTGTPDRLHAETVNGSITVKGGSGTLDLESVAGSITVNDFHGTKLSIDATSGTATITNATGAISVDNVNGSITMHGIHSASVSASTVNAGIDFEGPLDPAGSYDFSSQNESITLTLPADVSARMKVSTMNGELVSTQIPATTGGVRNGANGAGSGAGRGAGAGMGKDKGKHMDMGHGGDGEHSFTVIYGGGAASVSVDVFNGNVIVKKKP